MKKFDIFSFALSNFLRRKARSALTVLGVVIGTAAVVIMLSIGIGMNKGFEDQISSWGDLREITVWTMSSQSYNEETGEWDMNTDREPLDDISLENIRNIDHVKVASPRDSYWGAYLVMNNEKIETGCSVYGIDAASMADFGYEVLYGRLLDESDIGTTNFVMCYNVPFMFYNCKYQDWSEMVYWYESTEGEELPFNPVDDRIKYQFTWQYEYGHAAVDTTKPRIINQDAKCVGILVQNINSWGTDYSSEIYMDINGLQDLRTKLDENSNKYYQSEWGDYYDDVVIVGGGIAIDGSYDSGYKDGRESIYRYLTVMVDDTDHVSDVLKEIRDMGFDPSSSMDYLEQMQEQTSFLRSILGAIGAVAFFVAAISIANTMVMSIYERTREIGIMKVIGCKLKDIRGMFLVEAAIIGIVGGALGVGLSYGLSALVNNLAAGGGMESFGIYGSESALSIIPFWLDIAALVLATAVGVVSGLYPAIRATRLSALEAIKNE